MEDTKQARLRAAIEEANRFIHRAQAYLDALEVGSVSDMLGSPESGAARRASMDLTRSLAIFRRPF